MKKILGLIGIVLVSKTSFAASGLDIYKSDCIKSGESKAMCTCSTDFLRKALNADQQAVLKAMLVGKKKGYDKTMEGIQKMAQESGVPPKKFGKHSRTVANQMQFSGMYCKQQGYR